MKLTVHRKVSRSLAGLLAEAGFPLDLCCGGRGTCGKCRVKLCSGLWRVDEHEAVTPCEVLACRAVLVSESGEVDVPDVARAHASGKVLADWQAEPLPSISQAVIAIDIGTTTLAAVKIQDGEIIAHASCYNPQQMFGDNVIDRIQHASQGRLDELHRLLLDGVADLLGRVDLDGVERVAVAGNTVMSCLFHKVNPEPIGVLPFTPPIRVFPERSDLFGGVSVLTVPCICGYVGGDLTAGIATVKLKPGEMLVDIGTNCEIVYAVDEGVVCAAAAAGPAFEGAGLLCGCRAVDRAIDHFRSDGSFSTIGEAVPSGICGSGYIDFLAVQYAAGRINEVGRYVPKVECLSVADGIVVTEYDIGQLLKAKAAVYAGIRVLEEHCGRLADRIYLAGGFARNLDLANAVAIGMIPSRCYETVGNTSLAGAARLACEPEFMDELLRWIDIPREIPLNTLSGFEDHYIDGLLLP